MKNKKNQAYGYSSGAKKNENLTENNSLLFWLLGAFSVVLLFWSPFQKGLFNGNSFDFERPIYSAFVWSSIILLLVAIYAFYHWKLKTTSDVISFIAWLIPLTYLISLINAGSHYNAINMVYIQSTYVIFLLLAYYIAKSDLGAAILKNGFMISTYVIILFGIFNWFGNKITSYNWVKWFAADMVEPFYRDAVMTDANGLRLTSVFQYANSYAAFLIAALFCTLFLVLSSKKWYSIGIHGFMVVPIIISFFLTLSRGGLVILPVVLLLVLPFLKPYRQILYIIHLIVSFGLSLIILTKITNLGIELNKAFNINQYATGWMTLLVVSLINAVIAVLIQKFVAAWLSGLLDRFNKFRFANIAIPVVAIVVGAIGVTVLFSDLGLTKLLPENVRTRVENINFQQHSVLERGTFYKDALKLSADYPIFGAGGGAWSALYEKYQNNPYTSRQAHNFFLQYLVEVGIVGLLIFLGILAAIIYVYIRNFMKQDEATRDRRFIFYILAISLLVHSMIDFDLSYVYLGMLLFLSLGVLISNDAIELKGNWKNGISKYKWIYPSVLLILSIVCFFAAVKSLSANSLFRNAAAASSSGKGLTEITTPLDKALKNRPLHPDYTNSKIDMLLQLYNQSKDEKYYTEAMSLLEQLKQQEPHNRPALDKQIYALALKEQLPKALELAKAEIVNFKWDITLYEKSISLATDLGNRARTEKNTQLQTQYWNEAFETYNTVLSKMKTLESLPKEQLQGREFSVTPSMGLSLGQIEFIRGNYPAAENFFRIGIGGSLDDPQTAAQTRVIIRYYLATIQKQGKNDQPLMDKLLAKDPNEKQQIQNLVNAQF
ncbi:O-antigen ligase family protein [Paenibacillus allorhizosphaerae]|uniref:O-antigen ligase-related domain-containing protein n=1 Tax=Paenibacillus allorhizosphaerae TaxID=2849866 RepID=A0ABM8VTH6_9BACL|nr:O-antigen ligase family protein [Paenibacillus allorhizosphaerae]CAG7657809.1 hypothetical protein PAECIP111802_06869 [Paenibacillus allorhizosphaerae]